MRHHEGLKLTEIADALGLAEGTVKRQLHAAGRIVLRTEIHPLDAINEVLERLRAGEVTGRAVIAHG